MKLSKILKAIIPGPEGDIILEFRRISNKERNAFYASQLAIKTEGAPRGDEMDALRIDLFDNSVEKVYAVDPKGKVEDLLGDDDKPITPKDLPEDIKAQAVVALFEANPVKVKNF